MGRYRILSKKWIFWPVFIISIFILHSSLFFVTFGFINARRGVTLSAVFYEGYILDVVDINFLVFVGILILIYFIDTLLSIRKFKKGFYYFYFVNDPLLFRLEALLAVLFLGLLVTAISMYLNKQILYIFARGLIFDISYVVAMLLFGNSLISFVEMYQWFKKRFLKNAGDPEEPTSPTKSKTSLLLQYLKDEEFYEMFQAYCLKELSSENLHVFALLDEAKANNEMPFHTYKYLIHEHIRPNSNFEVNITSRTRAHCIGLHEMSEKKGEATIDYEELKGLYVEILNNLADTWARFTSTSQYKLFEKKKQQLGQMFGVDDTETLSPVRTPRGYKPWFGFVTGSDYKEPLIDETL